MGKINTEQIGNKFDVFISHANADKTEYVNELKNSIDKLKVDIFYDTDTIEWGDNWKKELQKGIDSSEFAIIVISESFFGREWTEKELNDFLTRQNSSGQKTILPILHNITIAQLKERYPSIADIQALNSKDCSCDEIALQFARQLIARIKSFSEATGRHDQKLDPEEQAFLLPLQQTYNNILAFRAATRRSNTEEINRVAHNLEASVQGLYDYYEYYKDYSGSRHFRAAKAFEIVNQYNAYLDVLHQLIDSQNNDLSPIVNDELQKLLRLVINTLHNENATV